MRPIRITFSAFGPFPGDQEIDFERLGQQGLFLITGPTGAGKTTVLDAMVYALYGEAAGARESQTGSLRSHFADESDPTRVIFEFAIGDDVYRVERSPEQARAAKRGTGTANQAAEASLQRFEKVKWSAVASGSRDVTKHITELIRLTSAQFQQVILLPQGKFDKVLRSSSKDRLPLLSALFGTKYLNSAVDRLKREAKDRGIAHSAMKKDLSDAFDDSLEDWGSVITEAGIEAASAAGIEFDDDEAPVGPGEQTRSALEQMSAQAKTLRVKIDSAAAAANKAYDSANTAADAATQQSEKWDRRLTLQEESTALAELSKSDKTLAATLKLAESANDLLEQVDAFEEAEGALADSAVAIADLGPSVGEALGGDLPTTPVKARASVNQLEKRLALLETAIAEFENASTARASAESEATQATACRTEVAVVTATSAQADAALVSLREELTKVEAAAQVLEALRKAAENASDRVESVNKGLSLDNQIRVGEKAEKIAAKAVTEAEAALKDARERHLAGLAARLAAELHDGDACPTCGSTEHPTPAEVPAHAESDEDIERTEAALKSLQTALTAAVKDLSAMRARRSELPAAEELQDAEEKRDTSKAAFDTASAAAGTAETLRAQVTAAEEKIASSAEEIAALNARITAADTTEKIQLAAAKKSYDTAVKTSPDADSAEAEYEATTDAIELVTAFAELLDEEAGNAATVTNLKTALEKALERKGFKDTKSVTAAAMEPDELEEASAELKEREARRPVVAGILKELTKDKLPDLRPDPTALIEQRDALKEERDQRVDAALTAKNASERLNAAPDAFGERLDELARLAASQEIAQTLADVASARRPPNIDLESWVCSAYLHRVVLQANNHLKVMTSGQYILQIGSTSDRRKHGGLDLDVFDSHTGVSRSVNTVSGGETFMASLALALGLAEVVAGQQNMRLDALFVDEGFGSLDTETLERATEVLLSLQTSGRMVGVISHVTEMRASLRTGIAVTKNGEQGSTLKVEYQDA